MFFQKTEKRTLQIESIVSILGILFSCAAMSPTALANSNGTTESQASACRTTVAVGVVKSDNANANSVVSGLAAKLTNATQVKAVPIPSAAIPSEQDFREQASRIKPDYLLRLEVARSTTEVSTGLIRIACGYAGVPCPVKVKAVYKVNYVLEEFDSRKLIKSGKIERASSDENKALGEVAVEINKQIGSFFNTDSTETTSMRSLYRKHLCYSGFPRNPDGVIMKYDVTTAGKKVAYDYHIKGNLWRVSIRPKGGQSLTIGYNGSHVWTLDRKEVTVTQLPSNSAASRMSFLLGEFLAAADADNLKYEISRESLLGKELVNGRNCHIVEALTRADTYVKFYYDAQTGALVKKSIHGENKQLEEETIFDEYREVAQGIRFPFKITSKTAQGEATIMFVEVVLNPDIQSEYFLKPAG